MLKFYVKVFYVMGKALSGELSCPCDRSCFLPKQSQKSRSILKDGSRSLGLFRKGKNRIIAKFHWIDVILEGETP